MKTTDDLFVVGIGASAGGLDAVQQLFKNLPNDSGIAFVIVQHLSPDFISLMPELLSKHTQMQIFTAEDKIPLKPNCIYLNQRNKNLQLKSGKLYLTDKNPKPNINLPIDIFFHTLGEEYQDKSIGVILSGTGSDGSRGIKTIKENGGTIMVQDPETAQFDGMPHSSIATNIVDFILDPKSIAEKIIQITSKRLVLSPVDTHDGSNEKTYNMILDEVKKFSKIDFAKYKNNTLLRRLEKRMSVHNIDSLPDYLTFLKSNLKEKSIIFQEFLIGVTSFFRDPLAFDILKNNVIPSLVLSKSKQDILRVWIPGCSSGEEVYSIAIIIEDYIRINKLNVDYKIFATDIDRKALQIASAGKYPVNTCAEIDKQHLENYFLKIGDYIQISKKIRDKIVFSYHDLTSDPPFIRMDLISCRNLLIYFDNKTQNKVISNFNFSLNKGGYLLLGSSESLGQFSKNFKTIDVKWKIFRSNTEVKRHKDFDSADDYFPDTMGVSVNNIHLSTYSANKKQTNEVSFYKKVLSKYNVNSVFIDSDFNILFIQGDTKKWISHSEGMYRNNLLNMISPELGTIIRNGIRKLSQENHSVAFNSLNLSKENLLCNLNITLDDSLNIDDNTHIFIVSVEELDANSTPKSSALSINDVSEFSKQMIEDLEHELMEAKSELQNAVEELETSNEELQSSNEELMSSNEELQSSNEELQSVNEELYTVNSELQEKNRELENLNNDMLNLLNSTDIGTLFLDTNLNIRKFTPAIKRIFNLEESDIGRSISSFASEFMEETRQSIISDSKISLEKLTTFERDVQDKNGNWYLKRISPFITSAKKIEGVVITFVDISKLVKTKNELFAANTHLSDALNSGLMAWWEVHLPSGKVIFSPNKVQMLGLNPDDFNHYNDFMKIVHPDDYENAMSAFRNHLDGKIDRYECNYRMKNVNNEYIWFRDSGKISIRNGNNIIISGVVTEISHIKKHEETLINARKKAEIANIYKNQFLANMSHEIRTPMNGLVGFAGLLRDENLSPEDRNKFVDIIESNSQQLLNLINDIIDVGRIEAGELKIQISDCNLSDILFETLQTFKEIINKKKKSLEIFLDFPDKYKNLFIKTDASRLRQVLYNLIGNSLKYSEKGKIEFGFEIKNQRIYFFVKDEGMGIPEDKLDIIFDRFTRVEGVDNAKYEGTGLGLAITKGIVELLGGNINVKSRLEKGTEFYFDIPLIESGSFVNKGNNITVKDINTELKNKTILIAEDDDVNLSYFKSVFSKIPASFIYASDGIEALDLFKKNPDINLILLDIRMPGLNGEQVASELLRINKNVKIIAQTANAMDTDRVKYLNLGFVDYIAKPISKKSLFDKILKWI